MTKHRWTWQEQLSRFERQKLQMSRKGPVTEVFFASLCPLACTGFWRWSFQNENWLGRLTRCAGTKKGTGRSRQ